MTVREWHAIIHELMEDGYPDCEVKIDFPTPKDQELPGVTPTGAEAVVDHFVEGGVVYLAGEWAYRYFEATQQRQSLPEKHLENAPVI